MRPSPPPVSRVLPLRPVPEPMSLTMSELGPSPLAAGHELPVDAARALIAAALQPLTDTETVLLQQALGRVLAVDVISPIDVPAHDNSAMDGYALRGTDLLLEAATTLTAVAGTVFAGSPLSSVLPAGRCVRIMTGAVMPPELDTVVPIELCTVDGDQVQVQPGVIKGGDNRRRQGEDLRLGLPALTAGQRLRPADLGLLASLGVVSVTVFRKLKVALFSTGDELRNPGEPLPAGCIYDSNRQSLLGALGCLGVDVLDLGLVADDPVALNATLDRALAEADVVLTSGGVSMGDADYTRDLLAARGEVGFWKVAMRPGRPFAFGPLRGPEQAQGQKPVWLFALPGNPVAALVTFHVFARDGLLQLSGARPQPVPRLRARSVSAIRKRPGRSEFQRGILEPGADGRWQVRLTGAQGAGILRSMSEANALVVLGHEQGSVAAGDDVDVWLFDGLL
jgi:molybdopterin molybdotransferase